MNKVKYTVVKSIKPPVYRPKTKDWTKPKPVTPSTNPVLFGNDSVTFDGDSEVTFKDQPNNN